MKSPQFVRPILARMVLRRKVDDIVVFNRCAYEKQDKREKVIKKYK
jgi:hypothetical protein